MLIRKVSKNSRLTGRAESSITPWSWCKLQVHRALAKGSLHQFAFYIIIVLILLGILSLCFSFTDKHVCSSNHVWSIMSFQTDNPFSAAFYHLFTNGGDNKLGRMPNIGWMVTVIGIVMVSVLTSLFTNSFDKTARRYLSGKTHYNVKNHVTIFGYHEMLPGLLKQLFDTEGEHRLFLIQTPQVFRARNELSRVLTKKQMSRIILQNGEIISGLDLPHMHVGSACEIFILGEEMRLGADSSHDTAVLQCLTNIVDMLPVIISDKDKILCHVMFEHHSTFTVFQHTDLNNRILQRLLFLPFNYYEMWARKVFVNDSLKPTVSESCPYLPLEGVHGIDKDSEDHVHLIVIGMSRMGVAMGMQAAHLAHYPNFIGHPERKTRITFIDRNARVEMYHLQGRMEAMFQTARWRFIEPQLEDYSYSTSVIECAPWHNPLNDNDSHSPYKSSDGHLGHDFIDVEWEFIHADDENPAVQDYLRSLALDNRTRLTVAVCVPDSNQAIAIGVNLPHTIYESAVQVLIYQRTGDAVVRNLSRSAVAGHGSFSKMHSFGMSSDTYDLGLINKLAFITTNINQKEEPGQFNKASESKSAAANMWSNIYFASHMWTKLRSVNSSDGNIEEDDIGILGKTEHVRWNVEQLLVQYRPLTDSEQKGVLEGKLTKAELKREKLAHLDIASQERLCFIDPVALPYDEMLIRGIPNIYKRLQR